MHNQEKTVDDSRTTQVQILMPAHINGYDRLFGGKLVEWIDVVAAVVARRHANANVTTVAIDNLQFKEAAYANSTVVLEGRMTYAGRTSMEVRVDTFVEDLQGWRKLINQAYLVLVALDEQERPIEVPRLLCRTQQEIEEQEAGQRRRELRSQRRHERF
ncbi:MAG: acyl-CoA thioesterase [Eubacteriales bacterium]|nr:acyl-CoA thioesterase [Eubacteriales bacterium]